MNVGPGMGAGLGAILAPVLAQTLQSYTGVQLDPAAAAGIAAGLIAAFGVLGHAVEKVGLRGIFGLLWRGTSTRGASGQ